MKSHLHLQVRGLLVLTLALGLVTSGCRSNNNDDAERAKQEQLRKEKEELRKKQEEEARKKAEEKKREEEAKRANSIIVNNEVKKVKLAAFFNMRFGANPPYNIGLLPTEPVGSGILIHQPEYVSISVPSNLKDKEIDLSITDPINNKWAVTYREKTSSLAKVFGHNGNSIAKKGSTLTFTVKNEWINLFEVKLHLVYEGADKKDQVVDVNYLGSFKVGGQGFSPLDDLRKYKGVESQKLNYDTANVKSSLISKLAKSKKLTELILLPAAPTQDNFDKLPEGLAIRVPESLLGVDIPLTVDNTTEQAQEKGWAITFVQDGEKREFFGNPLLPKLLEGSKLRIDVLGENKYKVTGTLIFPHTTKLYTLTCAYEGTFTEVPAASKLK